MDFELVQGTNKGPLYDIYFSPADTVFDEDDTPYVIEESIQASSETVFVDGPAEISHDGNSFPVVISVIEFDDEEEEPEEDEDDDGKIPGCYMMISSETLTVEGLAELLGLEEE